jgi:DNA/RNA endonuclease YhcR with UshA esterase domain
MPDQPRGRVMPADVPDLTEEVLKRFEGKRVRVTGQVRIVQGRAEVTLTEKSAIKEPS